MRFKKSLLLALNILFHSKLRTWLTIIGIIIGIGAVISIISISQGAQNTLEDQMGQLGADIITISPGYSKAQGPEGGFQRFEEMGFSESSDQKNLTNKDILVLRTLANVKYVMGQVSQQAEFTYNSKSITINVNGIDETIWKEITTEKLISGRYLIQGDSYSIVIGERIATNMFDTEIPLNSKVTIEGNTFTIVGILEDSSAVYMPMDIARTTLDEIGEDELDSISVKVDDVELSEDTVTLITNKLMLSRGILNEKEQDFSVSSPATMQETMEETMNTMSLFLGAIAAISLVVGAIGIANTMFTSVLEKTKEIGIMKAIGAKNRDILMIFLIKSGLIGFVGGIGGVILGYIVSGMINYFGTSTNEGMMRMFGNSSISLEWVVIALIFSIIIGMVAGAIPAYRASKLNPVDALREE